MSADTSFALKLVRDQIKAKLDERKARQAERDAGQAEVDAIVNKCTEEKRNLSDAETFQLNERHAAVKAIDESLAEFDEQLDGLNQRKELLAASTAAQEASKRAAERWSSQADTPEAVASPARVKSEARTYDKGSALRGISFFTDLYTGFQAGDYAARERLERHQKEARVEELAGLETRDVATSAFAGLTVPQYLTDLVAPLQRAMAPTVSIMNRHPLPPDGMTLNISRITTGTAVAVQSAEVGGVQETDIDDTLLTVNVRTYAGSQDMSRQSLERGTNTDEIVATDLANDYWTKVDAACLNSDGTGGTHLSIRSTPSVSTASYTDATPTAAECYRELAEIISVVQSAVYMGVTNFIMHPRRWWWLSAGISSSFPMMRVPGVDTVQAGNIGTTEYMAQNRNILGVPVVVDGNMLTNLGAGTEDVILGVTNRELHFWDEGVQFIRAEQPLVQNLAVRFVLYGYSAFTAGRYPGAHGILSGTGLIAPVFSTA